MLEKIMLIVGFVQVNILFFNFLLSFRKQKLSDHVDGLPAENAKETWCEAQLRKERDIKSAVSSLGLSCVRNVRKGKKFVISAPKKDAK